MTTAAQRARQDTRRRDGRYTEMVHSDPGDIDLDRYGNVWGLDPADAADAAEIDFRLAQTVNPDLTREQYDERAANASKYGWLHPDVPRVGSRCKFRSAPGGYATWLSDTQMAKVMRFRRENAAAWLDGQEQVAARAAEFDSARLRNTTPPDWPNPKTYQHPVTGHKLQQTWRESPAGWKGYTADGTYIGHCASRTDALRMLRNHHAGINPVDQQVLDSEGLITVWGD